MSQARGLFSVSIHICLSSLDVYTLFEHAFKASPKIKLRVELNIILQQKGKCSRERCIDNCIENVVTIDSNQLATYRAWPFGLVISDLGCLTRDRAINSQPGING